MTVQEIHQVESPRTAPSAEPLPDHEQIALLAYTLWQQRGAPEGSPEQDWFRAERELLARPEAGDATALLNLRASA
jgi:hypothetical protein